MIYVIMNNDYHVAASTDQNKIEKRLQKLISAYEKDGIRNGYYNKKVGGTFYYHIHEVEEI